MVRSKNLGVPVVVALVLLYFPSLNFNFLSDDRENILHNIYFHPMNWENLVHFWQQAFNSLFIPIPYTFWGAIVKLSEGRELSPIPFHSLNLFLHAFNVLLVYWVLDRVTRVRAAAWFGAAIFALHPLQVESVVYITCLRDLLAANFSFIAICCFLKYCDTGTARRWHLAFLATLAYTCALLSKPSAVVTPIVALILAIGFCGIPLKRMRSVLGLWIGMSAGVIFLTRNVQAAYDYRRPFLNIVYGTDRIFVALDSLSFYVQKFFLPFSFSHDYGRTPRWLLEHGRGYWTWLIPCLAFGILFAFHPKRRLLIFSTLFFCVALLPNSGIVPFLFQNFSTVADHYAYFSVFGLVLGISCILTRDWKRWGWVGAIVLLFLVVQTKHYVPFWHDEKTLAAHAISLEPNLWYSHYLIAHTQLEEKDYESAAKELKRVIEINPYMPRMYGLLMNACKKLNRPQEVEFYKQQLRKYDLALYLRLGDECFERKDYAVALNFYLNMEKSHPDSAEVHYKVARVKLAQGLVSEAVSELKTALAVNPNFDIARDRLELVQQWYHAPELD
jgi:protein O-mannosyl-transferase